MGFVRYLRLTCLVLIAFSELSRMRVTIRSLASTGICILLALIAWHIGQRTHVDAFLFIWGARNRSPRTLLLVSSATIAASVAFVIASSYLGIIANYHQVVIGGRERSYLGFRYALYPSAAFFGVVCSLAYLSSRRAYLISMMLLGFTSYRLYLATDSRLSFYLGIFVLILIGFQHLSRGRLFSQRWFCIVSCLSFIACALVSIVLTFLYEPSNNYMFALNQALSSRLLFGKRALERYGLSLFGTAMGGDIVGNGLNVLGERVSGEYFYIDCLYVRILLEGGLIMFTAYIAGMTALSLNAYERCDYRLSAVLIGLALHGMVDNLMMNLFYNPFLLLIGVGLSDVLEGFHIDQREMKRDFQFKYIDNHTGDSV